MKYLNLVNGDSLPMLGLGTWKSAPGVVGKAIREAITMGYRHIDCAYIYANEVEIGLALKEAIAAGDVKREDLWITSKLWNNAHQESRVQAALQTSLKRLQLDYLDLYLIHWPVAVREDVEFPTSGDDFVSLEEIPLSETWRGMEAIAKSGLSKHIGVSNFSVKKLDDLLNHCQVRPVVNQVEAHPLLKQQKLKDFCDKHNIIVTAYSPLGSLDRSKQMKIENEPSMLEMKTVEDIAQKMNITPAQVLISWSMCRGMSVIPKSTNPERMQLNLDCVNIDLDDDDMKELDALDKHFRYINAKFFELPGSPYTAEGIWDE